MSNSFFSSFESDVNSDSIQTYVRKFFSMHMFESDVNSDSIQTCYYIIVLYIKFESDVNSDSIQTNRKIKKLTGCLRVM